jgi:type IV pilus assembly protein PilE
MKKGFTLLELIVVIIIIGILATLGFTQYTRVVEKGRTAEAKALLGQMRTAQEAYKQEYGSYTLMLARLAVEVPTNCTPTHYFRYSTTTMLGTATRCTADGKTPNFTGTAYTITLNYADGTWGGTVGYY